MICVGLTGHYGNNTCFDYVSEFYAFGQFEKCMDLCNDIDLITI